MAPNVLHEVTSLAADIRVPPVTFIDPEVLKHFPELMHDVTQNTSIPDKTSEELEVVRKEKLSSPNEFVFRYQQLVVETGESFLSDSGEKSSPNSEPSDDIFDPEYVLAANTDWWQISPVGVDESEFGIVDVPHFDEFSNSALWEDVDTFVSVVDVSGSDVMEEEEEYEPVYKLDTHVTTVWGLDIIWEEEEL